jgi:hypothetical protein
MLQHWGLTPLLHGIAVQPGPEGRHRCAAATEPELQPRKARMQVGRVNSPRQQRRGMLQHWGLTPFLHGTAARPLQSPNCSRAKRGCRSGA